LGQLPKNSSLERRCQSAVSCDTLACAPHALFLLMLACGDPTTLARSGMACCSWNHLLLKGATEARQQAAAAPPASPQRQLWTWILRWGTGLTVSQHLGFWCWAQRVARAPADECNIDLSTPTGVLQAAFMVDANALLGLACGLGGIPAGGQLGAAALQAIGTACRCTSSALFFDLLDKLLRKPLQLQRLWLLSNSALPWLITQCRLFQVMLAAHHPQLFKHFFGEGLAPELFFCFWIQRTFSSIIVDDVLLRLWDILIFENSHKILVRLGIAILGLLEQRLRKMDCEKMMKFLLDIKSWGLSSSEILEAALCTKVTRAMLLEVEDVDANNGSST